MRTASVLLSHKSIFEFLDAMCEESLSVFVLSSDLKRAPPVGMFFLRSLA